MRVVSHLHTDVARFSWILSVCVQRTVICRQVWFSHRQVHARFCTRHNDWLLHTCPWPQKEVPSQQHAIWRVYILSLNDTVWRVYVSSRFRTQINDGFRYSVTVLNENQWRQGYTCIFTYLSVSLFHNCACTCTSYCFIISLCMYMHVIVSSLCLYTYIHVIVSSLCLCIHVIVSPFYMYMYVIVSPLYMYVMVSSLYMYMYVIVSLVLLFLVPVVQIRSVVVGAVTERRDVTSVAVVVCTSRFNRGKSSSQSSDAWARVANTCVVEADSYHGLKSDVTAASVFV